MHPDAPASEPSPAVSGLRLSGIVVALLLCGGTRAVIGANRYWTEASLVLIAGAVAAAALVGRPRPLAADDDARVPPFPRARSRRLIGAALIILGLGGFLFAAYLLAADWARHFTRATPLLIAALGLWSAGVAVVEGPRPRPAFVAMPHWERWLFVAILLLGVFLRFYRYGEFPPPNGFCAVEEPQAGLVTHHIIHEGQRPWEFVLDRWLPVVPFLLWGETPTALRFSFTVVSALTLIPFHLLLRQLVSRPAALLGTALFAVCRWHLIYARLGHNIFATTLIVVIIFYLCVRAHRRGGLALYPWIGFLTAYTLYSYAGYRGTALFVFVFLVLSLGGHIRAARAAAGAEARAAARKMVKRQLLGLGLAAIAYVPTVIPMVVQLRNDPVYFFEAANRSLANRQYYGTDFQTSLRLRIDRLRRTAEMFNHYGDESGTFNLPTAPMLDPLTGILFTVGLAYCLIWWRYRFQGFFAFTFLALLSLGTLFVQNLDIRRLQGIIPLIFVMIGFFLDRLAHVVTDRFGARARPALIGLALLAGGYACADNYNLYFHKLMDNPDVRAAFQNRHTVIIPYLKSLPHSAYLYAITDVPNLFFESDFIWWRGDSAPGKVSSDLFPIWAGQPGPWNGHDLHVIFQEPYPRGELVRLLQERFPDAQCSEVLRANDPPAVRFTACQVPWPPSGAAVEGGAHVRYFKGDTATPIVDRMEPAISWGFLPDECRAPYAREGSPPCRVEAEGTWVVPQAGTYTLLPEPRMSDMTVIVDGRPMTAPLQLTAGPHLIRVDARLHTLEEPGVQLRWRSAATQSWELMRFTRPPGG